MLSKFVITFFFPRSRCVLISWLQSLSTEILEPRKKKLSLFPLLPHLFAMKWWGQMPWSLSFWMLSFKPASSKDCCWWKKTRHLKDCRFFFFFLYGKMKNLGLFKSFLWSAAQLSGASILHFPILSLLRMHHWRRLQWLMAWWLWHLLFAGR